MMFKTTLKTAICIGIFVLCTVRDHAGTAASTQARDQASLKAELSKHREWTLVNPKPILMDPVVSLACTAPAVGAGPHSNKYISVYVNEAGRAAMMSERYPKFPEGSIIVKEKLSDVTSVVPELMTVMVKRGNGFDSQNGNWEYWIMSGDGSTLEKPANVASCQSCHQRQKNTDFVSRAYFQVK